MRKHFGNLLFLALAVSMLTGCANMQPLPTATGKPEVTVNTTDTTRIKGALVEKLAANGFTLTQDTPYSLAFSKQMEGGSAVLYQAALGNSYSSTPQINISFTFAPQASATRIFGHINTSMANAFGRVDQNNMDQGRAAHEVQAMLEQLKTGLESQATTITKQENGGQTKEPRDEELEKALSSLGHTFNANGFCIHCGWERDFIKRTSRPCQK